MKPGVRKIAGELPSSILIAASLFPVWRHFVSSLQKHPDCDRVDHPDHLRYIGHGGLATPIITNPFKHDI
jgi:hypothetical protein